MGVVGPGFLNQVPTLCHNGSFTEGPRQRVQVSYLSGPKVDLFHDIRIIWDWEFPKIQLMDKILHDPKDPKLWELWYIPYDG